MFGFLDYIEDFLNSKRDRYFGSRGSVPSNQVALQRDIKTQLSGLQRSKQRLEVSDSDESRVSGPLVLKESEDSFN